MLLVVRQAQLASASIGRHWMRPIRSIEGIAAFVRIVMIRLHAPGRMGGCGGHGIRF